MIRHLITKFYRIVIMRIYSDSTVLLMERRNSFNPTSPASIQEVTNLNIHDALHFQSQSQVEKFQSFLKNGDKGYYGYLNNICVHRSWVVLGPAKVKLHKFYSMELKANQVFVQYCETANEARGKNIFAHMLAHIANQFSAARVLTSVDEENSSSIKSMLKAGFVECDRKRIKVILGKHFIS